MLTKDLIRYKIQKGHIYPQFIEPTDSELLAIADQLINLFEKSPNTPRATLLESSKHIIDSTPREPIIKRGLEKLLLDRTEFDTAPNAELIEFRKKLFIETSRLLSQEQFQDYTDYQHKVSQIATGELQSEAAAADDTTLTDKLYADLPSCQPVLTFRTLSPERLLHRYNAAQVQGLLLHCNTLVLRLSLIL